MKLTFLLAAILLSGSVAKADEAKPVQDLPSYLDQLQVKLEHTAQRANQPSASGANVIGLRGSKQEPLSKKLYWKGKSGDQPVTLEEVKIFRTAIEQAKAGDKDHAVTTLKSFVEKYPKSALKGDAQDTIQTLASAR